MKKVTMKDVAAAAGVSVAAVSRVMNGSGYVAPDKRERVGRDVDRLDRLRAVERGVDGKPARAAAQVEHVLSGRVGL